MAVIISSDEIKKTLPNYNPNKAEEFHTESAKLADKLFYEHLGKSSFHEVIIMAGGAASGKTEFLATQLDNNNNNQIIFDTTLSSIRGAKIKIEKILKAKKQPILYFVFPDDVYRAYTAFLHRDRKFSDAHFYRTHSGSRLTLLWIVENFPQIKIHLIESSYTDQQIMNFTGIEFTDSNELKTYIQSIQMTETDIINIVTQT